jgi:acyl-CoA synthetase (AMP-forming)/AMP-acid ligase II
VLVEHSIDPKASVQLSTLPRLLEHQAKRIPEAPAILAPARPPLSYGRLHRQIEESGHTLRAIGIGRYDRVAVALPNGPEMAVATLAVAARAVCAPLNPEYAAGELNKYFADLRVSALVTEAGIDSPARRVALSRGIRVVELSTADDAEAGRFALAGGEGGATSDDPVGPDDVALLMLTSGTTSRPKAVASTHANVCTAAQSWGPALALTEDDRCLNLMPLFHGHGLIAVVLASLAAGASVVCAPGYAAKHFFEWQRAFRPTWYSAVPTIHQSILAEARRRRESTADYRLRFVRSGSAPLPPSVLAELERTFQAPCSSFAG